MIANAGIYFAFGFVAIVWYAITIFVCGFLSDRFPILALIWIFVFAFGLPVFIWRMMRHYLLYMVKAGHIAVMVELLERGKLPDGTNQITFGKNKVAARFKDASILSGVDVVIRAAVHGVTSTFEGILNSIPIPGISDFSRMVSIVIRIATDYVDEAILAQSFIKDEENVWAVAKDSIVLYASNWKPIIINASLLAIFSYISSVVFAVIFSIPAWFIVGKFPSTSLYVTIAVLVFAWLAKFVITDNLTLASTLVAYYHESKGKEPDRILEERLASLSAKFAELRAKASEGMGALAKSAGSLTGKQPQQS